MTKHPLLTVTAWGTLASALVAIALPAQAQDPDRGRAWGREARAEARAEAQTDAPSPRPQRSEAPRAQQPQRSERRTPSAGSWSSRSDAAPVMQVPPSGDSSRGRDWAARRQAREAGAQQHGSWSRPSDREIGARIGNTVTSGWKRDPSYGANARHGSAQRNHHDDARRAEWQRDHRQDGWRSERRDDARNYANGYRDGHRADNHWSGSRDTSRYGQAYRRWDNRGWRSDNRYDWYRYRSANRSIFNIGRYYAPYSNYSYSRINIGFRLGSGFYSNRYWINDPWRYRLPDAYGPYRWVRYYDDALLVDIYTGQVVDVIHDFFW